jgi:hypothetical protein
LAAAKALVCILGGVIHGCPFGQDGDQGRGEINFGSARYDCFWMGQIDDGIDNLPIPAFAIPAMSRQDGYIGSARTT